MNKNNESTECISDDNNVIAQEEINQNGFEVNVFLLLSNTHNIAAT